MFFDLTPIQRQLPGSVLTGPVSFRILLMRDVRRKKKTGSRYNYSPNTTLYPDSVVSPVPIIVLVFHVSITDTTSHHNILSILSTS